MTNDINFKLNTDLQYLYIKTNIIKLIYYNIKLE